MRKSLGVNHISEGSRRTILNQKLAQFNKNNNTYSEQWPSLWRTIPLWASLSTKWVHYGTFFLWKGPSHSHTMEVVMLSSQRVGSTMWLLNVLAFARENMRLNQLHSLHFCVSCGIQTMRLHQGHTLKPSSFVICVSLQKNAPEKNEQLNNGWANISWSIWGKLGERACEIHICNQCVHKK